MIATLATQAAAGGDDVIVVTGDRDTYQLVEDPHIKVLYNRAGRLRLRPLRRGGHRGAHRGHAGQYPQYAALRGDPSDNLPGVPGVGEKTAAKLINTYGDLDGIYAHLDELSPKLRQSLADAEAQVRANAAATPLVRDVPVEVDPVDAAPRRVGPRGAAPAVRLPRVPDPLGPVPGGHGRRTKGAAPASRPPAPPSRSRSRSWSMPPRPSVVVTELASRPAVLAMAGAWDGPEGRSALLGLALAALPGRRPPDRRRVAGPGPMARAGRRRGADRR